MDSELQEKDFILDESKKSPNPFLMGLFFIAVAMIILSAIQSWYREHELDFRKNSPFYQVTNRDFTLFLWQNPRFMHTNVSSKQAYLPADQFIENISPENQDADLLVNAPDNILFLYHTWQRLLDTQVFPRAIPPTEFKEFLEKYREWMPAYWPNAPKDYAKVVTEVMKGTAPDNLATLPVTEFPNEVRTAFIGWKNFTYESEKIESLNPTFKQLKQFLEENPTYARNYWINLLKRTEPNYLETYSFGKPDLSSSVPDEEISPFLKLALFNYLSSLPNPSGKKDP